MTAYIVVASGYGRAYYIERVFLNRDYAYRFVKENPVPEGYMQFIVENIDIADAPQDAIAEAVAAEREACAKVAETIELPENPFRREDLPEQIAAAIRARGEE